MDTLKTFLSTIGITFVLSSPTSANVMKDHWNQLPLSFCEKHVDGISDFLLDDTVIEHHVNTTFHNDHYSAHSTIFVNQKGVGDMMIEASIAPLSSGACRVSYTKTAKDSISCNKAMGIFEGKVNSLGNAIYIDMPDGRDVYLLPLTNKSCQIQIKEELFFEEKSI